MAEDVLTAVDQKAHTPEELEQLERQLEVCPDDADMLESVASAHYRSQNLERAMELYARVTENDPERPSGWYFLGNCLYRLDYAGNARDCWEMVVALEPEGTYAKKARENLGGMERSGAFQPG